MFDGGSVGGTVVTEPPVRLPEGLAEMAPGPELAAALAGLDRDSFSGYDKVVMLKARARLRAWCDAEFYADIHSVSTSISERWGGDPDDDRDVFEGTSTEVASALHLTRRSSEVQVDLAFQLCERLPQVWIALHEVRVDLPRARVISDQTSHLPEDLARGIAEVALERASSQTTGQLRARLARLIISADPDSAKTRYQQGLVERRVVSEANTDGTANLLGLSLPVDQVNAGLRRINRLAKAAKSKDDPRSMDQVRADVFLDVLCGRHQASTRSRGGDRGVIDLRVGLTTLLGLDESPGELPGWGPVIADIARKVTAAQESSEWRVTATDDNGEPVAVITTRRRPNTVQKRRVKARNPHCVFPGCRMPADQCDLDHQAPWAQTHQTSTRHLEPLCRHHHRIRHRLGWKLRQIEPGVYEWTSPLGHVYTTKPEPP